jgi:hypothetical protein
VRSDQETGNNEEDVDADVAAGQPLWPEMVQHDNDDGDSPQTLDFGLKLARRQRPKDCVGALFWRFQDPDC